MPILFPKVCACPGSVQQIKLEWVFLLLLLGIKSSLHFAGMLLRFFVHFYDMEIIEEEAFLSWKEDVTQEYPGKGKALFQVLVFTKCKFVFYPCKPVISKPRYSS